MNSRPHTILISLVLLFTIGLTGCNALWNRQDTQDYISLDQKIREAIEKTIPLPESAAIRTHIGDEVTFSSELTADEVVQFYRDSYSQKGYQETESETSADPATLLFKKEGEKTAVVEITGKENGCDVHIQLESANP
jgi:hypothetical protein